MHMPLVRPVVRAGARDRRQRLVRARTGVPTTSRAASASVRSIHHTSRSSIGICLCLCVCLYIFFMGCGLDPGRWHHGAPGAVIPVPHGCPATIRAIGTTAHAGAVATVPHGCPASIRAIGTTGYGGQESPPAGTPDRHATGRGYARRTLALRGAAGRRRKRYRRRHTRASVDRAQVGGCASSVAYMPCWVAVHMIKSVTVMYILQRLPCPLIQILCLSHC
jgi:hypothetical protein